MLHLINDDWKLTLTQVLHEGTNMLRLINEEKARCV